MSKRVKLFGTDGIRGVANQYPMSVETVVRVGQALGVLLKEVACLNLDGKRKVVIGKDTRLSGYMIENALASGLNSMGVNVQFVGPLPTPGIGFLTTNMRADAGIVISASHNAYLDNGIKIFGGDGFKISNEWEKRIEELVLNENLEKKLPLSEEVGRSKRIDDSAGRYIVHVKNAFPLESTLDGLRIVLDCANGAAYKIGPAILEELGAEVICLGNQPNGRNINDKCGALYPQKAAETVKAYRADIGITLDGDADRVIMIDEKGRLVNGDQILAICAIHLKERGMLKQDTIVTTEMSNFGLDSALSKHGIKVLRTKVGDKNVVEEMKKKNSILGGESSGHIIFLENSTTGDGLIAALNVLSVMRGSMQSLSRLTEQMKEVPQVLKNVQVNIKKELDKIDGFSEILDKITEKLNGEGRIFVRYSGTEPLVRVLVEGPDRKNISQYADQVASFLQKELN